MTTTILDRLKAILPGGIPGAIQACANGCLYWHFDGRTSATVKTRIPMERWTNEAQRLAQLPTEALAAFDAALGPKKIGGKHADLGSMDEGWARMVGAVARIGDTHGMNFAGTIAPNGILGRALRHIQKFQVAGPQMVLSGFSLFHEARGVAQSYAHAYLPPVVAEDDDSLWAIVEGLVWICGLQEAGKWADPGMSTWAKETALAVGDTEFHLYETLGGRPQFVRADLRIGVPGREFECAMPEVRATIHIGRILVLVWALTGYPEFLAQATRVKATVAQWLKSYPFAHWMYPWGAWFPVGLGDPARRETRYKVCSDLGPDADDDTTPLRKDSAYLPRNMRDHRPVDFLFTLLDSELAAALKIVQGGGAGPVG